MFTDDVTRGQERSTEMNAPALNDLMGKKFHAFNVLDLTEYLSERSPEYLRRAAKQQKFPEMQKRGLWSRYGSSEASAQALLHHLQ